MSDKPNPADIRERARKYLPGMVGYSARLIGRMSVEDVSHGCVRNDPELMSDAVMNAGHLQFKDVPALLAAVDAVLAEHRRVDANGGAWCAVCADPVTQFDTFQMWPCPTVRAVTAHLDIEPR